MAPRGPTAHRAMHEGISPQTPQNGAAIRSFSGAEQPVVKGTPKYGRIEKARVREAMPTYEVPRSKKLGDQQKGLNWLSQHGKEKFDKFHQNFLAQWGVKPEYESIHVLCPEDWSSLEPRSLLQLFTTRKCPTQGTGRLSYAYSDHTTSYARALVWFDSQSWLRSGMELDNFLGAGPFQRKHASHTCHHEYYLVHLILEDAHTNQDRKTCYELAIFLRQEGLPIPKHCDRHNEPCLMQVRFLRNLRSPRD